MHYMGIWISPGGRKYREIPNRIMRMQYLSTASTANRESMDVGTRPTAWPAGLTPVGDPVEVTVVSVAGSGGARGSKPWWRAGAAPRLDGKATAEGS
jgi:hypothetical protein